MARRWFAAEKRRVLVREPGYEILWLARFDVLHHRLNLVGRYAASEHSEGWEVFSIVVIHEIQIAPCPIQLIFEHRHSGRDIFGAFERVYGSKACRQDIEATEWKKHRCHFTSIPVQLPRKPRAAREVTNSGGNQIVIVTVCRWLDLLSLGANVMQSFVAVKEVDAWVVQFTKYEIVWLQDRLTNSLRGSHREIGGDGRSVLLWHVLLKEGA